MGRRNARGNAAVDIYSSFASMSCMRMKAGRENPPLTRRRVTQLSYPITRTDPEPLADVVITS